MPINLKNKKWKARGRMIVGDTDVSECEYLKVKPITLNWGIGKEYTKEYRCKKHNDLSCELFDECEYKRCKRLNDFIKGQTNEK